MLKITAILFTVAALVGCGNIDSQHGLGGESCSDSSTGVGGHATATTGGSGGTSTASTGTGGAGGQATNACICDCPAGPPEPLTVSEFCDPDSAVGEPCCIWHNVNTLLIGTCSPDHVCFYTDP